MIALKILIIVALVFAALSLGCAVWIGRRRDTPADPFAQPFGEMPGFTAEQLRRLAPMPRNRDPLRRSFATRPPHHQPSAGFALRPDAGGDGSSFHPDPDAARFSLFRRTRRG